MSSKSFAVMGSPIAHSLSPRIHLAFAKQCALQIDYRAIEVTLPDFVSAVNAFFHCGGRGLNITAPLKEAAFDLAAIHQPFARLARSVNTLYLNEDDELVGDNTDGIGLITSLLNHLKLAGARVLLLGAGGAARGVIAPLLQAEVARLHLANRTLAKVLTLKQSFVDITVSSLAEIDGPFDVIINATSAGLKKQLPAIDARLVRGAFCYDMNYGVASSAFCQWAKDHGARGIAHGGGMLLEQAAAAFYLWHGVRPVTATLGSLVD